MKCKNMLFVIILTVILLKEGGLAKKSKPSSSLFQIPSPSAQTIDFGSISFGTCTYNEISQSARHCESIFFKELIQQSHANCKQLFKIMQNCMLMTWSQCLANQSEGNIYKGRSFDMLNLQSESSYCDNGALSLPTQKQPVDYCDKEYSIEARKCVQGYYNKFTRNPADRRLCGEYLTARICLYRAQDALCRFGEINLKPLKEVTRQLYRCWNPFCVWRRRPVGEDSMRSLSNVVISPDEQKQGIPDECRVNTAYVTMGDVNEGGVKVRVQPPIKSLKESSSENVNRPKEKPRSLQDKFASNPNQKSRRKSYSVTPPSGHASKTSSPLACYMLYMMAVLIMILC